MTTQPHLTGAPRIQAIDALRAFALIGIIVNHSSGEYVAGPPVPGYSNVFSGVDQAVAQLTEIFTFGKFFTIFSFLFGLSFAIQASNATQKGERLSGRFLWRLLILFAIGFTHSLFYSGDILRIYAFLGLILLACQKLGNKTLLIVSTLLILNAPLLLSRVMAVFAPPPTAEQMAIEQKQGEEFMKSAGKEFNIKRHGSVSEVIAMNISGGLVGTLFFQIISGRLFITLGLFLLGLYVGRQKLFNGTEENITFFKNLLIFSGLAALISTILALLYNPGFAPGPTTWLRVLGATAFDIHQASLSVFYVAGFTLLFWKKPLGFLSLLVPAGQMGLTVYLTQTIFGLLLFFGFGFGMMGKIGVTTSITLALMFYALQIVLCNVYMKHFRFGPVEWLWRSLTYMKFQSIRIQSN